MAVLLFLVSVFAALLGPVAALGGVLTGILWVLNRHTLACMSLSVTAVALGFVSSIHSPTAAVSAHVYFIASHICAMALWGAFAALLSKLLPEETPAGRRLWLKKRARLGAFESAEP